VWLTPDSIVPDVNNPIAWNRSPRPRILC
jgi:hypothetical protein